MLELVSHIIMSEVNGLKKHYEQTLRTQSMLQAFNLIVKLFIIHYVYGLPCMLTGNLSPPIKIFFI